MDSAMKLQILFHGLVYKPVYGTDYEASDTIFMDSAIKKL